ncbi:DEAD/DEAH box helicase [Vibrio sp. WXL103]|uniref:DEAD/DEAH box helicase n=1 Tax=Vibrio sp. WXL103 TaxID=3450710 RepID=UPI003EC61735
MKFSQLGLNDLLAQQLSQLGFVEPTEVQQQAIPHVLAGKDVLAAAQTGTGKTAAFALPILHQLLVSEQALEKGRQPRVLVLVPTRELAQQVLESIQSLAEQTHLTCVALYGGTSMGVQTNKLKNGCDVVIATPGRLLDHLYCKNLNLKSISHFVLDEADRMLDMGFKPDIQRLLRLLGQQPRQTLLFSATFHQGIKNFAYRLLDEPIEVEVSPANTTAELVEQIVYPVDKSRKSELLAYLIGSKNWQQVLVFTKTKQGSDALAKELKLDGIEAVSINGDKSQGARQRALDEFKQGKVRALIATDVAARGLDIPQLEQVVNYEMPFKAEDYVHRIGRTGRAGHKGLAVSLMSHDEQRLVDAIERLLDTRLPQEWLAGYEPKPESELTPDKPKKRLSKAAQKKALKARLGYSNKK